jgi:hypothetical protein
VHFYLHNAGFISRAVDVLKEMRIGPVAFSDHGGCITRCRMNAPDKHPKKRNRKNGLTLVIRINYGEINLLFSGTFPTPPRNRAVKLNTRRTGRR